MGLALVPLCIFGVVYATLESRAVMTPATTMAVASMQPLRAQIMQAEGKAFKAAAAGVRAQGAFGRPAGQRVWGYASAIHRAAVDGARAGCRGSSTCVRAVGPFFGTQAGKTQECADIIAAETGLEATDIADASAADLAGFDGIIAGVPTWHTGADEQRSGTAWDDYLEEIRGLDLNGKPCAIFGLGDSVGYGDNFCDAIEELHSTFSAAGAKMLGQVDPSGYEYQDSKSAVDGKFLGLPLDGDNEPDMSEDRIKKWVAQLKSEGMPV